MLPQARGGGRRREPRRYAAIEPPKLEAVRIALAWLARFTRAILHRFEPDRRRSGFGSRAALARAEREFCSLERFRSSGKCSRLEIRFLPLSRSGDAMAEVDRSPLSIFEAPRPVVEAALGVLRIGNTALDALFYDVAILWSELLRRGTAVVAGDQPAVNATKIFETLDLGALANPEGSILVVDASGEPFVTAFDDVEDFLHRADGGGRSKSVKSVSITGVGSSALGSVAFAWNLSVALGEPVAAIVPGYGVADVIQQALGGWFGFGLTSWIKRAAQETLARAAPETAQIGRRLMMTAPEHESAENGAPVFLRGNGSSDVLHSILKRAWDIDQLFGHSKGALVIGNAIGDLPEETTRRLLVMTFGCPIREEARGARYLQFLGVIDGLGQANSWGNKPEVWLPTHHSTNSTIPMSMLVSLLTRLSELRAEAAGAAPERLERTPSAMPVLEALGVGRDIASLSGLRAARN
jgi:hypothetical protein